MTGLSALDWWAIGVYLTGLIGFGWWLSRSQESAEDYFLGARARGTWSIALSILATQCSTNSILGAPAFVAFVAGGGLIWLQYELAVPLAMIVLITLVFPALYRAGGFSIYELLERRFDRSTRVWLSGIFQIARVLAAAVTIYGVASIIALITGLTFFQSVLIFGLVTVVYDYFGGINGVIFSDVLQMTVLVTVLIWVFVTMWDGDANPFETLISSAPERAVIIDFASHGLGDGKDFAFWPMLFGGLFLYVAYYGLDQSQAQRLLTASSEEVGKKALFLNGVLRLPLVCLYCAIGVGLAHYAAMDAGFMSRLPEGASGPDFNMALPLYMIDTFAAGWLGLAMVALLAAAMSSLDSVLNALSATTVSDFLMPSRWGKRQAASRWIGLAKLTTLVWGLIAMVLAFWVDDISSSILVAINKIGSLFNGPILGVFACAMLTTSVTGIAVRAGLIAGFVANVYAWIFLPEVSWLWWNVLGAIVCFTTAVIGSAVESSCSVNSDNAYSIDQSSSLAATGLSAALFVYFTLMLLLFCLV